MTEDYKLKLFNYINNNYQEIEPASDYYQIEDMKQLSYDEGGLKHPNLKYLMKDNSGVENGLILYVENIEDQETGHKRSIYELREINGTYIANIQYTTSGEELPETEAVYVEDDGTLFIKTSSTSTTFPNRIMMLNNICNKVNNNYVFKIRKSYNIQDYYGESALFCTNIYKSLTEAKYILVGYEKLSSDTKRKIEVLECTINVGAENEYYLVDNLTSINGRAIIYDCFIKWNDEGNYKIKIILNTNETSKKLREYVKDYNQTILSQYAQTDIPAEQFNCCYTTHEDALFGILVSAYNGSNYIRGAVYTISNNMIELSNFVDLAQYLISISPNIDKFSRLNVADDDVYLILTDENNTGLVVLNIVKDNNYYLLQVKGVKTMPLNNIEYGLSEIILNKQYALNNIYSFNNTRTTNEILQTNTYTCLNQYVLKSGASQDLDSFVPNIGILRNNDLILFARELYNLIRQQNTITSTVNVPNVMLNDNQITKEQLAAKSNNIIDENNEIIEKNIYEDLLINFNDTITIVNNNENNNVVNTEASVDLVKELITNKDYNKVMNKFRIIYQDNTSVVDTLPTPTIEDTIATYHLVVGSTKPINRIEFISFDETTTYVIITLNVEANKVYIINQKVRVR